VPSGGLTLNYCVATAILKKRRLGKKETNIMTEWNWSSREEWAKRQRTVYADQDNPLPASSRLEDYASPYEIEEAITELKTHWKVCGREMAAAKAAAGSLAQQPHETALAFVQRYLTMDEASQDLAMAPENLCHERKKINKAIRELRDGELPSGWRLVSSSSPALGKIWDRWEAAAHAANNAWVEQVANTPIDDAAWEEELERRAELENPEIERVTVITPGIYKVALSLTAEPSVSPRGRS
jgi:hypothetical protein